MSTPTPSILSSPFLTHDILDTLLSQSPSLSDRINLLSAKIHLYANPSISSTPHDPIIRAHKSSSKSNQARLGDRDRARTREMKTRIEVAGLWVKMGQEDISAYTRAEAELGVVLDWAKGALKGIQRRKREKDKRRDGIGIEQGKEKALDGNMDMQFLEVGRDEEIWGEGVLDIKKRAEGMLVLVNKGSGSEERAERLRRQLGNSDEVIQ